MVLGPQQDPENPAVVDEDVMQGLSIWELLGLSTNPSKKLWISDMSIEWSIEFFFFLF